MKTEFKEEVLYPEINGLKQRIIINTRNPDAPILLNIHGHGTPTSLFAHFYYDYNTFLVDNFIIVHWDQRGTGKSYSKEISPDSMNQEQFVEDAHEVAVFLMRKYKRKKIYVLGQSWGSIIGLKYVLKHPDEIHAYMGVGQVADYPGAIQQMYDYSIAKAEELSDKKKLKVLRKMEIPDASTPVSKIRKFTNKVSRWSAKYLIKEHGVADLEKKFKRALLSSPYFKGIKPKLDLMRGRKFTQKHTLKELMGTRLQEEISELQVPVYFFEGRYDFYSCGLEEMYNQLDAPEKELIWFNEAGHAPVVDQPEKGINELKRLLL